MSRFLSAGRGAVTESSVVLVPAFVDPVEGLKKRFRVLVRPRRAHAAFERDLHAADAELSRAQMKNMQEKGRLAMRKEKRDHADVARKDFEFFKEVITPLREKARLAREDYATLVASLFLVDDGKIECGWLTLISEGQVDAKTSSIVIKGLPSNMALSFRLQDVENEQDAVEIDASTEPAAWQSALQRKGLGRFSELLRTMGKTTPESWTKLSDAEIETLGMDVAESRALEELVTAMGVITEKERERISKEKEEIDDLAAKLVDTMGTDVGLGDPVSFKKHKRSFGVVVKTREDGSCDVRVGLDADGPVRESIAPDALATASYHVFLSHSQREAQNSVAHLGLLLRDAGIAAWIDTESLRLAPGDMARGIRNSAVFVVYLTSGYLERFFCQLELTVALALKKPIIVVYESDVRHGGSPDFVQLVEACSAARPRFKEALLASNGIAMQRRAFQRRAVVDEIVRRIEPETLYTASASAAAANAASTATGRSFLPRARRGSTEPANSARDALRAALTDAQMEINDLKAENQLLWKAIEELKSAAR